MHENGLDLTDPSLYEDYTVEELIEITRAIIKVTCEKVRSGE